MLPGMAWKTGQRRGVKAIGQRSTNYSENLEGFAIQSKAKRRSIRFHVEF